MKQKVIIGSLSICILCLSVVAGLSLAYASMTRKLDIEGYASMNSKSWSVHFANLSNASLSNYAVEISKPQLRDNATSISGFNIKLHQLGDYASYTFDVVNDGDFDATISSLTIPKPVCSGLGINAQRDENLICNNLIYTLTYTNGDAVELGDVLTKDHSNKLRLTLKYVGSSLPENVVEISGLGITIVYSQN